MSGPLPTVEVLKALLAQIESDRKGSTRIVERLRNYRGRCEREAQSLAKRVAAQDTRTKRLRDFALESLSVALDDSKTDADQLAQIASVYPESEAILAEALAIENDLNKWRTLAPP